jgi:hypothetical protein
LDAADQGPILRARDQCVTAFEHGQRAERFEPFPESAQMGPRELEKVGQP